MEIKRTFDLIDYCSLHYPNSKIFFKKRKGKWTGLSVEDLQEHVVSFSSALHLAGVKKGDIIVSIFSGNSWEWNIIDFSIVSLGAVHLPIYPTLSDSDYIFILRQSEAKIAFVSDQIIYNKLSRLLHELPDLERIVSIEKLDNVEYFETWIDLGRKNADRNATHIIAIKNSIGENDICSIIYTSGTTGFPKGVMLTHRNFCFNLLAAASVQPLGKGKKVLSFLPLCHVYERTAMYQFMYKGVKIYYAESLKSLLRNLREVKPHGTTMVPRILEKILKGVLTEARKKGEIFSWFVKWCVRYGLNFQIFANRSFSEKIQHGLADILVYRHLRRLLGGKLQYVGCGGAPVQERIERFFWAARISVYQGYGLTECAPLVALNFPGRENISLGTVGPPVADTLIKIADNNEILVKSPSVMAGYFKNEELTLETLKDGWLHTGDLGEIINDKFLKITGRCKEMFKTSYGKYIVPQAIESRFMDSEIIEHIMVIGEGKHCAAAIIAPNFEYLHTQHSNVDGENTSELIKNKYVQQNIRKEIAGVNAQLGSTEQIKKYILVPDTWSQETGELSATGKLRRNIIMNKYALQINELYKEESFDDL